MTSASVALADCFFVFLLPIVPMMSRVRINHRSIWIMYSESNRAYRHSVALKPSRGVDTYIPKLEQF